MLKPGDKVTFIDKEVQATAVVKFGPYAKEFYGHYADNTPTSFVDDVYDIEVEGEQISAIEGVRRRYLKKIHPN